MKTSVLLLILLSVGVTAVAQILLRRGMSSAEIQSALSGGWTPGALAVAGSGWVMLGLLLYAIGAVIWLLVLSRTPVSVAYPFVGLGFVITMFLAWSFLGEAVTAGRVFGTLLVTAGVILIARGV